MVASQIQHGEPRRLVMSAPTPLRQDFDASQLRGLARKTKDGPQARRLLALAAIYDGATRTEAAKIGGVDHPGLGVASGHRRRQADAQPGAARHGLPLEVIELGRFARRLAVQESVRPASVEA